jgi:hypothetical protein
MSIYPSEPTVSVEIEARWGCNDIMDHGNTLAVFERKQERPTTTTPRLSIVYPRRMAKRKRVTISDKLRSIYPGC